MNLIKYLIRSPVHTYFFFHFIGFFNKFSSRCLSLLLPIYLGVSNIIDDDDDDDDVLNNNKFIFHFGDYLTEIYTYIYFFNISNYKKRRIKITFICSSRQKPAHRHKTAKYEWQKNESYLLYEVFNFAFFIF